MLLLVDNDELFRTALAAILRDDGYHVSDCASGGSVALDRLQHIEVLLNDAGIGLDGLEFAKRFHAALPSVPVVIVTASISYDLQTEVASMPYARLLHKPVDYEDLLSVLHALNCHPRSAA